MNPRSRTGTVRASAALSAALWLLLSAPTTATGAPGAVPVKGAPAEVTISTSVVQPAAEEDSSAYAALGREIGVRAQRLSTTEFGYFGVARREQERQDLAVLQRAHRRLTGYARSLPSGCLQMLRRQAASAPPAQDRARAPARSGQAAPGPTQVADLDPRSKAGMLCRPRGTPPDELVLKVRAVEADKERLARMSKGFNTDRERRELQQRIEETEGELRRLGVPAAGVRRVKRADDL